MEQLIERIKSLDEAAQKAALQIKLAQLEADYAVLEQRTADQDFWNDQVQAQTVTKQAAKLKSRIVPWRTLLGDIHDALEMAQLNDASLITDLTQTSEQLEQQFDQLKQELLYSGPYDDHDALVGIYAGAGGTDAQDWAEMLLRMYVRWAEAHPDISVEVIEQSNGEEAGIKSATLSIQGPLVYGKLRGEHGVHRLVRLSPFNADNLRQTSFAKVDVLPKIDTPEQVEIDEKDLKIDVYRAGGHGGQSVNTTDSAVRVTHMPTGITVAIQNERSQLQNKETAMTILRSKLAQLQIEQHKERVSELKGPNEQAAWGNQIRNYVLHPYSMVKDTRTKYETSDTTGVLDGKIDEFIQSYLENTLAT